MHGVSLLWSERFTSGIFYHFKSVMCISLEFRYFFQSGHLVVRMLSWGAPRATLPMFIGGDAAVVRGVGAGRGMRMGHRARLVVWPPARIPELRRPAWSSSYW